jgi:GTPase SAR1 family protein
MKDAEGTRYWPSLDMTWAFSSFVFFLLSPWPCPDGFKVKVNFWDVAGDPVYYEVRNEFYKDTQGVRQCL